MVFLLCVTFPGYIYLYSLTIVASRQKVLTHCRIVSVLVIYILCILVSFIDILVSILVLYILSLLVPLLYIIVSILVPKETSWILSPPSGTAGTDILQQISVTHTAKILLRYLNFWFENFAQKKENMCIIFLHS